MPTHPRSGSWPPQRVRSAFWFRGFFFSQRVRVLTRLQAIFLHPKIKQTKQAKTNKQKQTNKKSQQKQTIKKHKQPNKKKNNTHAQTHITCRHTHRTHRGNPLSGLGNKKHGSVEFNIFPIRQRKTKIKRTKRKSTNWSRWIIYSGSSFVQDWILFSKENKSLLPHNCVCLCINDLL